VRLKRTIYEGNFGNAYSKSRGVWRRGSRYLETMSRQFLSLLRLRKEQIQNHWRTLLRIEPSSSPLANPETLQYLIPEMFERVFAKAEQLSSRPMSLEEARRQLPNCACGNNPYRAFFVAAEQAITEAVVLLETTLNPRLRDEHALAILVYTVRTLAVDEIDTFCAACLHHGVAPGCRFTLAAR
jgi:hypothetical protein